MNECDQIHPLLRGYLQETISASQRRIVARHLNLCAASRKELEKLRQGSPKVIAPFLAPKEPWDIRVLRWLFQVPKPLAPKSKESSSAKKTTSEKKAFPWKPLLGVVVFFVALVFLTHFVQNAGENPWVKNSKKWISQKGWHLFGINPALELVLDLSNLPHWSGDFAPVAFPYQEMISDADHFKVYWQLLQPGQTLPKVDFLGCCFFGPKDRGRTHRPFQTGGELHRSDHSLVRRGQSRQRRSDIDPALGITAGAEAVPTAGLDPGNPVVLIKFLEK